MKAPDSSDRAAACACKGIRRCLICEKLKGKGQFEANGHKVNIQDGKLCLTLFLSAGNGRRRC